MSTQKKPQDFSTKSPGVSDAKIKGGGGGDIPIFKKIVVYALLVGAVYSLWKAPTVDAHKEWGRSSEVHYSSAVQPRVIQAEAASSASR